MPEYTCELNLGNSLLRVEYIDPEKPIEKSDVIAALYMVIAKLESGGTNMDPKLERFKTAYGKGAPPIFWEGVPAEDQGKELKDELYPRAVTIQRLNEDCSEESFPNEDNDAHSPLEGMDGPEIEAYIEGERSIPDKDWTTLPGGARKPPKDDD